MTDSPTDSQISRLVRDRKSTRLNSSHSLHDALPIWHTHHSNRSLASEVPATPTPSGPLNDGLPHRLPNHPPCPRSEEHTSELQSLPTRRSSDLAYAPF